MFIFGWVFIAACKLSLVAVSRGYFLVVACELLIVVASLVAEHGLLRAGSVVVARGFSCPVTCGIFLDQGSNPCPLYWQADSYPLYQQGSPPKLLSAEHFFS